MSTEQVSAILGHVLASATFNGQPELQAQAGRLATVSGPPTTIDIQVADDVPVAEIADGLIPVKPLVVDDTGAEVGELLIWVTAGRLSALEFAWWSDTPPTGLPEIDWLRD